MRMHDRNNVSYLIQVVNIILVFTFMPTVGLTVSILISCFSCYEEYFFSIVVIFTARNWLCFYRCLSVHGGVPGLGGVSRPTPKGEAEGDLVQVHTQVGSWGGSGSGPHPRGKLRGIWSRPTPKGEVEGDLVQAHTQGGSWGGTGQPPPPSGGYCCRQYASYCSSGSRGAEGWPPWPCENKS